MELIETVTVGSGGAASITFSAIPDTFTDLCLQLSLRSTRSPDIIDYIYLAPNGSSSNFSWRFLRGINNGVGSFAATNNEMGSTPAGGATANTFGNTSIYIPNYGSSTAKSISVDSVSENNDANWAPVLITAALWNDTSPITSITITNLVTFAEFSSASLFGITAGSDGIVTVS